MAESSISHFNLLHQGGGVSQAPPTTQSRSSKATTAFARLAHTVIGSSRPTTSAGSAANTPGNPAPSHSDHGSRSIRYRLDSPVLALSASPERDHAVVAGREILKILRVSSEITDVVNLRTVNANTRPIASSDVKWGVNFTKDIIATAATNGMVCIYDLNKGGKLDRTLHEHNRSVHKIAFNPTDGRLILSGSQDGTMKLWDLRQRRSRCTMVGRCDAVRDVQFNEVRVIEFAAAFDNGTIQMWDSRQDNFICKINAHNGPVFSVDWHPDGKHVASGGRDKTVKIWDFFADSRKKPKHTISTLASIGHIAWRPKGVKGNELATELATCAINHDFRLQVWDLKRPYIATCVLDAHDSASTGLLWKDENTLWSTAKYMTFMQHDIMYAVQPINQLSHSAFSWNQRDDFTFAIQPRIRPRRSGSVRFDTDEDVSIGGNMDKRRQSRAPSFKSGRQNTSSNMLDQKMNVYRLEQTVMQIKLPIFDSEPFQYMAEHYKTIIGDQETLSQVCEYNGAIAWAATKFRTAQSWRILGQVIGWEDEVYEHQRQKANAETIVPELSIVNKSLLGVKGLDSNISLSASTTPIARPVSETPKQHHKSTPQQMSNKIFGVDEALSLPPAAFATSLSSSTASTDGGDVGQFSRRNSEQVFSNDNPQDVKTLPALTIATPSSALAIDGHSEEKPSPTGSIDTVEDHPALASYGSLPIFSASTENSAIQLPRTDPVNVAASNAHDLATNPSSSSYDQSFGNNRSRQYSFGLTSEQTSSSIDGDAEIAAATSHIDNHNVNLTSHMQALHAIAEESISGNRSEAPAMGSRVLSTQGHGLKPEVVARMSYGDPMEKPWNSQEMIDQLVGWYSEHGDVQMCAMLVLLFSDRVGFDQRRSDDWVENYVDRLRAFKLFVAAAEVTKATTLHVSRVKGQTNTYIHLTCHNCYKPIANSRSGNGSWYCDRCQKAMFGCIFCHEIVKGNWVMCQACSHGGHDTCLRDWFFGNGQDTCPAVGCLHQCLPLMMK